MDINVENQTMTSLFRRLKLVILSIAGCCIASSPAFAISDLLTDYSGAEAGGDAQYIFRVCGFGTQCDAAGGFLSSQFDGGVGFDSANVSFSFGNGAEFRASATLQGNLNLPVLKAFAKAQHQHGTHEGFSTDGDYDFLSNSYAQGTEFYTYVGSEPADYVFSFNVDGTLNPSIASLTATAFLSDVDNTLNGELPLGEMLDWNSLVLDTVSNPGMFNEGFTLHTTLLPNQHFYLRQSLQVSAGSFLFDQSGTADAYNTYISSLIAGDPNLLQVGFPGQNQSVPEPNSIFLLSIGLITLLITRYSIKQHSR